ncbi:MAG: MarR family transcriptional regulator [bacterium]
MKREGGFLVSKIHQISGRIFFKKLKEKNIEINAAQGRILFVLWKQDNLKINELAKRTSLSKTSLTSMLERLELMGYIVKKESEKDKRSTIISLTEKNIILEDLYKQVSDEMTNLYYKGFTCKEINLFEEYLIRILSNLDSK